MQRFILNAFLLLLIAAALYGCTREDHIKWRNAGNTVDQFSNPPDSLRHTSKPAAPSVPYRSVR